MGLVVILFGPCFEACGVSRLKAGSDHRQVDICYSAKGPPCNDRANKGDQNSVVFGFLS